MSFAGVWTMATFFFGVFLCVDGPICLVSLCAGCVLSAQGAIGLASTVKVVEDERKIFCYSLVFIAVLTTADLWSFIYQHEEKSGWCLVTMVCGGSVLLLGGLLSGISGCLSIFGASDSPSLGDAMVYDHLFLPDRSTLKVQDPFINKGSWLQVMHSGRRRRGRPGEFPRIELYFSVFSRVSL